MSLSRVCLLTILICCNAVTGLGQKVINAKPLYTGRENNLSISFETSELLITFDIELYQMKLAEAKQQFISSWGAFGTHWGINRTMASIHALLLVSPDPLSQDDIMERLFMNTKFQKLRVD